MYPALAVSAGALATRLAALARSAAPTVGSAMVRLRSTTSFVGNKVDDLVAWAKASPGNASMVALTLASLGVSVTDLFETDQGKEASNKIVLGQALVTDYAKIDAAGAASQTLNFDLAKGAPNAMTAIEILRYAKQHYGSAQAAMRAHRLHQAFFEMSKEDVLVGYDTLAV